MGRPRGSKHTAMVNGRITAEQMEWLEARADELGGNLSAALRQTITDARTLELMRMDYQTLRDEHPDFRFPPQEDGTSYALGLLLAYQTSDPEADALTEDEKKS